MISRIHLKELHWAWLARDIKVDKYFLPKWHYEIPFPELLTFENCLWQRKWMAWSWLGPKSTSNWSQLVQGGFRTTGCWDQQHYSCSRIENWLQKIIVDFFICALHLNLQRITYVLYLKQWLCRQVYISQLNRGNEAYIHSLFHKKKSKHVKTYKATNIGMTKVYRFKLQTTALSKDKYG